MINPSSDVGYLETLYGKTRSCRLTHSSPTWLDACCWLDSLQSHAVSNTKKLWNCQVLELTNNPSQTLYSQPWLRTLNHIFSSPKPCCVSVSLLPSSHTIFSSRI